MSKQISGSEYPLSKIFSSEFEYHIPPYQRPYAWTEEETSTLFDDLYDFYCNTNDDDYFLGSIVLIKQDNKPCADVIDGQQRLTTLTILLAVIASKFSGENRDSIEKYLVEPGNDFEGLEPAPRLFLREKDKEFFANYVQSLHIQELLELDIAQLDNEAKSHILLNAKKLNEKIDERFGANIKSLIEFVKFLVQRCFLIAVCTPNQTSAHRIFSVMNSRGLDLLPTDIIKAEVIGKINNGEQDHYNNLWEDLEVETTRTGFSELFGHIRMIYAKNKAKKSLYEEFNEYIMPIKNDANSKNFIDNCITPYCDAFNTIRNAEYKSTSRAESVNNKLMWLNKIDNSDWMPVAIKFLSLHAADSKYVDWFFSKLERLASCLLITSKDVNYRITRYCRILAEMEEKSNDSIDFPLCEIELEQDEINAELFVLSNDIYHLASRRRNYIMLRLDSFVSDGAAIYNPRVLTIEHVLPQMVATGSEWESWWPNEEIRKLWTHRIANLVLLSRKINSEAQNYDFGTKKTKYFTNVKSTSSYALTTQVINNVTWNPEDVTKRQQYLLDLIINKWDLKL